jgi:hypothetical protein
MLARDVRWFSTRAHPSTWTSYLKDVSGTYYAVPGDQCRVLVCDTSSNPVTVFLPAAADVSRGAMITIKDTGNAANNSITLRGKDNSEKIDGSNIVTLDTDYTSVPLVSTGTKWLIL